MKKNQNLLKVLIVAMMASGCTFTQNTSSSETSSTESSSSVESSSVVENTSELSSTEIDNSSDETSSSIEESSSSSESSSSESSPEVQKTFLDELNSGFIAKSTYAKKVNNGTPSNTCLKTYIGNGVAKWEQYSGSNWESVDLTKAPTKVYQYQNNELGDAVIVNYNMSGEVISTPLMLKDALTGTNVEAFWSETMLDNAFAQLTIDNFTRNDDGTYSLDLSAEALENEIYKNAVISLARQLYMVLGGSEYVGYTFVGQMLTSFVITLDENDVPVSYEATFEDSQQSDGWGGYDTVSTSISGEFEHLGSDSITKLTTVEAKYEELDAAFASLKNQNYEFNITQVEHDDLYGDSTKSYIGKADGTGNFYVNFENKGAWSSSKQSFGYSQLTEDSYRKYSISDSGNIWNGEAISGSTFEVLPTFSLSSAFFTLDEENSTSEASVYTFSKPQLIDGSALDTLYTKFGTLTGGWALNGLTVTVSENSVTFDNVCSASRTGKATFTNIGAVGKITTNANEVSDLVAAYYEGSTTVDGTTMTIGVKVQKDGVFAMTKDGEHFGSYGYTINADNKIILDNKVTSDTFMISKTTGEGDSAVTTNYTCSFNTSVTIDNPFNPSAISVELKYQQEGKSYASTKRITLNETEYVEPTKELTFLKDTEDSYVMTIYYDLYDYSYGELANYIPYILGAEAATDYIWNDEYPEGFQILEEDAPEGYIDAYLEALVNDYGYTMVEENVYENSETGLRIEVREEYGYVQFYIFAL